VTQIRQKLGEKRSPLGFYKFYYFCFSDLNSFYDLDLRAIEHDSLLLAVPNITAPYPQDYSPRWTANFLPRPRVFPHHGQNDFPDFHYFVAVSHLLPLVCVATSAIGQIFLVWSALMLGDQGNHVVVVVPHQTPDLGNDRIVDAVNLGIDKRFDEALGSALDVTFPKILVIFSFLLGTYQFAIKKEESKLSGPEKEKEKEKIEEMRISLGFFWFKIYKVLSTPLWFGTTDNRPRVHSIGESVVFILITVGWWVHFSACPDIVSLLWNAYLVVGAGSFSPVVTGVLSSMKANDKRKIETVGFGEKFPKLEVLASFVSTWSVRYGLALSLFPPFAVFSGGSLFVAVIENFTSERFGAFFHQGKEIKRDSHNTSRLHILSAIFILSFLFQVAAGTNLFDVAFWTSSSATFFFLISAVQSLVESQGYKIGIDMAWTAHEMRKVLPRVGPLNVPKELATKMQSIKVVGRRLFFTWGIFLVLLLFFNEPLFFGITDGRGIYVDYRGFGGNDEKSSILVSGEGEL